MKKNILQALSLKKYERLLPRVFPDAARIEIRDLKDQVFWDSTATVVAETATHFPRIQASDIPWVDVDQSFQRRRATNDLYQFRAAVHSREFGQAAWLIVSYNEQHSTPVSIAPTALRRAFADAIMFMQEELDLALECQQLAVELTERYEELNLVYSTKDRVTYLEEGHEALTRLVENCVDYLDVGHAALICKDRNLVLHCTNGSSAIDTDSLLETLGTTVYAHIESRISSLILNDDSEALRQDVFAGYTENLLAHPIVDDHGTVIGIIAVVARRLSEIFSNGDRNLLEVMAKKASRIIHTHHDSLTGLLNRIGFEPILLEAMANARTNNQQHSLVHINIDKLHVINDLMGHQEGDLLLRRVAKTLRSILRDSDYLARLGGDEFAVLVSDCTSDQSYAIAEKIRAAISELSVRGIEQQLDVSVSIGIAAIGVNTDSIINVMASAEIACKMAKDDGRDRIQVFAEENTSLVRRSEEIEWISRVQQALRDDEFELHCQPVLPLADKTHPPHFEILIRLRQSDGTILPPSEFLPAAERYQLMPQIDRWVIKNTFQYIGQQWKNICNSDPVFCVNLSGQSLADRSFLLYVSEELRNSNVPAKNICFEITETAAISNIDDALTFMHELRGSGCHFSLDDFGAGLSSFGYLKELPVDYLKIDGSFIRQVSTDMISKSIVEAICQVGKIMGLQIVAEFVGDEDTVQVLNTMHVDFVQGYYIGKPVPLVEIADRLRSGEQAKSA